MGGGGRVSLVLRPEAIELQRGTAPDAGPARVLSRTFLGEKIEYELECMGQRLQSVHYNAGSSDLFGEDESVALRCTDDTVIALKETK